MDVIDVDEVLKDDSFCLLEERGQDDISNILQQWKSNFNLQPGSKLDTRTFTRPKRKSTTNYDSSTALMTPKLQDISPPSSLIFSSLDFSPDQMNNSLISSADFKNVRFFMASPSDDFPPGYRTDLSPGSVTLCEENMLQALTLSGDSTLIKDSSIAQIDHDDTFVIESKNDDMYNNSSSVKNTTFDLLNSSQIFSKKPELEQNVINVTVDLSPTSNELNASDVSNMFNKTYGTKEAKESCSSNYSSTSEEGGNEILGDKVINKTYSTENVDLDIEFERCGTPENDLNCEKNYIKLQSTPHETVYNIQNKRLRSGISDEINLSPVLSEKAENSETEEHKQLNGETKILKELYSNSSVDIFSRDKNEEDFDDLLESFGKSHIVQESNKIRQSLDNIKKRHSLIISEKCNSDAKPRVLPNNSSSCKPASCERLLSRRSRLYDEVPLEKLQNIIDSPKDTPEEINEAIDNHESTNQEDQVLAGNPEAHTDKLDKLQDRDRFKTIRVLKKRDEYKEQKVVECKELDQTPFVRKDTNITAAIPDPNKDGYMTFRVPKKEIPSRIKGNSQPLENSKSGLSKRLFYNGKAEVQSKVNSTGELEKCSDAKQSKGSSSSNLQDNRSLPMKAKSYQNLASQMGLTSKMSNLKLYSQAPSHQQISTPNERKKLSDPQLQFNRNLRKPDESDGNQFKAPLSGVQARNNQRSGLIRPSSGFYSFQVRADGELESRHSSSNSLSSASSRGSIQEMHRNGVSEQSTDPAIKRAAGIKSSIPKPSGIKPPSVRRSIIPVPSSSVRR